MTTDADEREERLIRAVAAALARIESGERVDVLALCDGDAALADEVRATLGLRDDLAAAGRAAADVDPMHGRRLAQRYVLGARLGQGAMGVVHEAHDETLQRTVAIKMFPPLRVADADAQARFLREAELLAALSHPHVVAIFDRGRDADGTLFLVTERLRGLPLSALVADELAESPAAHRWPAGMDVARLPETTWLRLAVRWIADAAEGLAAAHRAGIRHRDVKPSNLFVRTDFSVVLLDFGIATRDHDLTLTATQTTLGTPYYMAPEQARGGGRPGPQADVYGLAATLYHLLTGQPPFGGDPREALVRAMTEDPTPPGDLRPDLPRDLRAILEHGLERDPRRRYADGAAFASDLRAFLEHRPVSVRALTKFGRAWRRVRRAPAKAAAVVATLVAALLFAVVLPLWNESRARAIAAELDALEVRRPLLLAVEGTPAQRATFPEAEMRERLADLDRHVALAPDALLPRLLRSALRLDLRDHDGAADDAARIAARADDPATAALRARYDAADRTKAGIAAVSLADLPAPTTDDGCVVVAFHELRARARGFEARAEALLRDVAQRSLDARDLHLIALLGVGKFDEARRHALALRDTHGERARWLAVTGLGAHIAKQFATAIRDLEASDARAPDQHGTLQNLGNAYWRSRRFDDARRVLLAAAAVRPLIPNTPITLAQVDGDSGDHAGAIARLEALDVEGAPATQRAEVLGIQYARLALTTADPDARAANLAHSVEWFERAEAMFTGRSAKVPERLTHNLRYTRALRDGAAGDAVLPLLATLIEDPADPHLVAFAARVLSTVDPDPEQATAVVELLPRLLSSLASALAPDDPGFRNLAEQIAATRARPK